MGWGNCGQDSRGRPIGYCHRGRCDHLGCESRIDRGLAYACGGMHGTSTLGGEGRIDWDASHSSCEGYFCEVHRRSACLEHEDGKELWTPEYCLTCAAALEVAYRTDEEWRDHWPTDAAPLDLNREAACAEKFRP